MKKDKGRYLSREEVKEMCTIDGIFLIKIILIMLIAVILVFTVRLAIGDTVSLAWDPNEPPPDGYRIYQRLENQSYEYGEDSAACQVGGNETTCTINGLQQATAYFFVARAFVGEEESGDSNEVVTILPVHTPQNLTVKIIINIDVEAEAN